MRLLLILLTLLFSIQSYSNMANKDIDIAVLTGLNGNIKLYDTTSLNSSYKNYNISSNDLMLVLGFYKDIDGNYYLQLSINNKIGFWKIENIRELRLLSRYPIHNKMERTAVIKINGEIITDGGQGFVERIIEILNEKFQNIEYGAIPVLYSSVDETIYNNRGTCLPNICYKWEELGNSSCRKYYNTKQSFMWNLKANNNVLKDFGCLTLMKASRIFSYKGLEWQEYKINYNTNYRIGINSFQDPNNIEGVLIAKTIKSYANMKIDFGDIMFSLSQNAEIDSNSTLFSFEIQQNKYLSNRLWEFDSSQMTHLNFLYRENNKYNMFFLNKNYLVYKEY